MRSSLFYWIVLALMITSLENTALAQKAVAHIQSTDGSFKSLGTVSFHETEEGLSITASLSQVAAPGQHGIHIHQFGACTDGGKDAGGHFNPDHVSHGFLPTDGFKKAHAGDLGNIDIQSDQTGKLEVTIEGLTLSGSAYSVAGRAIILHALEDDFGQPTGNAGSRIGCGTIALVKS